MELETGLWIVQIPPQQQNKRIYLQIIVNSEGTLTESVRYNYYVYGTIPIVEIQGNGNNSPYENQQVSVTGIVTASYSDGYYIQDDTHTRSGIYIYDTNRKTMIGNVVQLTGTVIDYYGLTEIKSITSYKLLQISYPLPEPVIINTEKVSKNYQSMFVRLNNVTCTTLPDGSGNWQVADSYGAIKVHNNGAYSFTPTLNQKYNIQGILTSYNGTWSIELRKSGDVETFNEIYQINDELNKIHIYPNPANNFITIQVKEKFSAPNGILSIYSIEGKLHYSEEITLKNLEKGHQVNIDNLSSGTWIISIKYSICSEETEPIFSL
jgi:DNA/RNA endonuclease YhcR with UshA esterase domain